MRVATAVPPPWAPEEFVARLRSEGARRYHDGHPFHLAMHEGRLTRLQLQGWVQNRFYYQTRIPIKDALILAKSDDPGFRRSWVRRVRDHDGEREGEGGIEQWLVLAEAVGLRRETVRACLDVLPGVRLACDGYVNFVDRHSLLEAVASSLTEAFAPDLMSKRIEAWEKHYPWVARAGLDYFRARVPRARRDAAEAIEFVVEHADSREKQEACVGALVRKTEILWHLLTCVDNAFGLGPREAAHES